MLLLLPYLMGCGGSGGPTGSDINPPVEGLSGTGHPGWNNNGRVSWGFWEIAVNTETLEHRVLPQRDAQFHFNVLHMLETWACDDCVTIEHATFTAQNTLMLDIGIRHPYEPNRLDLTGRDVRGVVIFDGTTSFPNHTVRDVDSKDQPLLASRRLLNSDGYTTHFNRWTAKEGTHLTNYLAGRFTHPDEQYIVGNLHPFKYHYTHEIKRMFYPSYTDVRTYELDVEQYEWVIFGYSVDASWNPALTWPVTNPIMDFNISTNAREAYQISMTMTNNMLTRQSGFCAMEIDIFDHQGIDTVSTISIEAPDLFSGKQFIDPASFTSFGPDWATYEVTVNNTNGAAKTADGGSDLLVVVEDIGHSVVGEDVHAYDIFVLPVQDTAASWRPRDGTFFNRPFPGLPPTGTNVDMTVVRDPVAPWALNEGEPMLIFTDDSQMRYIGYNRDFDTWQVIAGYPASPNSWLVPTRRIDAAGGGAFGVASGSDYPVDSYEIRYCTNTHSPGGVYIRSWYTGSLSDPDSHYEFVGDVSGGFGNAIGDPIYSIYLYESGTIPTHHSVHRIQEPYNDPVGVIRSYVPVRDALSGNSGPYGVSQSYFTALGVDDDVVGEGNPMTAHIYTAENQPTLPGNNSHELDIWKITFSDPLDPVWVRTYHDSLLGNSVTPPFQTPRLVDIAILPAAANNIYMGEGKYAQHNWVALLFYFDNFDQWFIEIFDPFADDPLPTSWQEPLYWILPIQGEAFSMDVDTENFEIYVYHETPFGVQSVTCYEYY